MAFQSADRYQSVDPIALHPGLIAQMIQAFLAWNDARATRKALERLSDRELTDIGLTRFDVTQVR